MEDKIKENFFDEREKMLLGSEAEDEQILNMSLRPQDFGDFIGQSKVIENLKISLTAAQKRNEVLEHIILAGPPGLGKTTLAHIITNELGAKITATSGPAIERAGDLIGILTNLGKGDILFIDEIHRISKVVEEFLYPAMENFQIDFIIDKGPYAKTIKFNLKPFTLIGATTRSGLLSAPMRGRFGMFYHLDFYEPEDLIKIIKRSTGILNVQIDDAGALEIARRSRGTPRIANRLLRRVRDYAEVKKDGKITKEIVEEALSLQGVDSQGLDSLDRKILKTIIEIYKGGPVGIDALSATLNEEKDTISDVVEPFLLKIGMIKRSPQGRVATDKAYAHLGFNAGIRGEKELFEL
ncbi:MAG: Holliday junction branch migration DNA helicase RuvB [Candidatus Omnitrophota bacterium]